MTDCGSAIIKKTEWSIMPPTRQCLICEKLENPNADIVTLVGWICPECKNKLQRMISREAVESND